LSGLVGGKSTGTTQDYTSDLLSLVDFHTGFSSNQARIFKVSKLRAFGLWGREVGAVKSLKEILVKLSPLPKISV